MKRFLTWLCLEDGERLVRIKSLLPTRNGMHGVEWPTLLVDLRCGRRMMIAPVWDWDRIRRGWQTRRERKA